LKPFRILFALCALAIAGALIAGCGGDDESDADPQAVLDDTFDNDTKVASGNLTLSASVDAEGEEGGSFEASISGPYQGDPDNAAAIPQLDWTVSASGEVAGQSLDFDGGLVLTDDNAFVEYNDGTYELGADTFAPLKEQLEAQADAQAEESPASFQAACEQALSQAGATDESACDIDPASWLTNVTNEGTEDVGGSDSTHIHGDANLDQILADIGGIVAAVPGLSSQGFDPSQLQLLEGAVDSASVDVYSTTDDNLLSKLDVNLTLDLTAIAGSAASVPVSTVDATFGYEVADINEEQSIEAPSDAQPIDELFADLGIDLGDLGALGGLGGLGATGGGGGGAPDADAYLECLQQAGSDAAAINACASEL
jgi:hypothetical protein